jgi:hypothetical protein
LGFQALKSNVRVAKTQDRLLTAVCCPAFSAPPASSSHRASVSAAAVPAELTAADPFAPAVVAADSAPLFAAPDDYSEEAPTPVDSGAAKAADCSVPAAESGGSVLPGCSAQVVEAANDNSVPVTVADRCAPVAEWVGPAQLARVPRDSALADSAQAGTGALPAAEWPAGSKVAPDDIPGLATAPDDCSASAGLAAVDSMREPTAALTALAVDSVGVVHLPLADSQALGGSALPVALAVDSVGVVHSPQAGCRVVDCSADPVALSADSVGVVHSPQAGCRVADCSADPVGPSAKSAEDDCLPQAGSPVAGFPRDSAELRVRYPDDSSRESVWLPSLEAPASPPALLGHSLYAALLIRDAVQAHLGAAAGAAAWRRTVVAVVAACSWRLPDGSPQLAEALPLGSPCLRERRALLAAREAQPLVP